jgi:hypothetical protein
MIVQGKVYSPPPCKGKVEVALSLQDGYFPERFITQGVALGYYASALQAVFVWLLLTKLFV